MKQRKVIIVSGINLYKAGSLKMMQDCLSALSSYVKEEYRVIAFVHKKDLYAGYEGVEFVEFPKSRQSWFYRLYYEYIHFRKLSLRYKPYLWLSMHDMTPNVVAPVRAVYCHNTSAFYKSGWKDLVCDSHFFLFSFFYNWLYRINIKKNNYVIVQQEWLRGEFERLFGIDNVIVASPETKVREKQDAPDTLKKRERKSEKYQFFYPSVPRTYKNFELVCQATEQLMNKGVSNFQVYLTLDGTENRYARKLYERYHRIDNLQFIGFQDREGMEHYYRLCDCLLFPSKLESWGLPLMEAKERSMPVLSADLPYAKETMGAYDQVAYFDPDDASELTFFMKKTIRREIRFIKTKGVSYQQPYADTWNALFAILLKNTAQ